MLWSIYQLKIYPGNLIFNDIIVLLIRIDRRIRQSIGDQKTAMPTEYEPVINNWYRHQDNQLHFCIIDIDEAAGVLDIQLADGDLDTMDIDIWYESDLELASEPEHWSVGLDNVSDDSEDNLTSSDPPLNWQIKPADSASQQIIDSDNPEKELHPDAIDERVLLQEWQTEETVTDPAET